MHYAVCGMRWLIQVTKTDLLMWNPLLELEDSQRKMLRYPFLDDLPACLDQLTQLARLASASSTVSIKSVRTVFTDCGFQSKMVRRMLAQCGSECNSILSTKDNRGLSVLHRAISGNELVLNTMLAAMKTYSLTQVATQI